jgi:hypothetical protein
VNSLVVFPKKNDGRLVGTRTPDLYRVKGQQTNTKHAEVRVRRSFNGTESGTEFPGRCLYALCEAGQLDFPFDKDERRNAPECQHDGKG